MSNKKRACAVLVAVASLAGCGSQGWQAQPEVSPDNGRTDAPNCVVVQWVETDGWGNTASWNLGRYCLADEADR